MINVLNDQLEELRLVADVFDMLSKADLRPDQVTPLTGRIRHAADVISSLRIHVNVGGQKESGDKDRVRRTDSLPDVGLQVRANPGNPIPVPSTKLKITKPSSISAFPVPREKVPRSQLAVSKEVSRCLCCVLYNILEGATILLQASMGHIFVRQGDEMVSIANCTAKLAFPPQLVRQKCLGSLNADVLASGIALNQKITDSSKTTSSLLIFPIRSGERYSSDGPVATVHIENKNQGSAAFNELDEGLLLSVSQLIGELMGRFPQMDWIKNFYDPVTQHILSPFVPRKRSSIPRIGCSQGQQPFLTALHSDAEHSMDDLLYRKIDEYRATPMIRREVLPRLASQKPIAQGLSAVPSLREVDVYLENLHSCWKRNVVRNVTLSEEDSANQIELKTMRRELTRVKALYKEAEEELRLYRLEGRDYTREFHSIKAELDAYVRKRDKLDV